MNSISKFVAVVALWVSGPCAFGGYAYSVTQIGSSDADTRFEAESINDRGDVVGREYTHGGDGNAVPVIYSNGEIIKLMAKSSFNVQFASGIDGKDEIGANTLIGDRREAAIITGQTARLLPDSGELSMIEGASENGTFVGIDKNHGALRAVAWINGKLDVLSNIPGSSSEARAVNQKGEIVGSYADAAGNLQGYSWQNGVRHDLVVGTHSIQIATDVNDRGDVIGFTDDKAGEEQTGAIISGKFIPLLPLPGGSSHGNSPGADGEAINDADQIVGSARDAAGNIDAALFENGKTIDLNTVIAPKPDDALSEAIDINNRGQILAAGRNGYYLLTPQAIPLPASVWMGLTTLPLLGIALRRTRGVAV